MMKRMFYRFAFLCINITIAIFCHAQKADLSKYVNPRIGSEGLGRVFIGPSTPFGMVKPSPDFTPRRNSVWLPRPEQINGFAQTHVIRTGG